MSEKLIRYLTMQINLGKLTLEEVQAKYAEFTIED